MAGRSKQLLIGGQADWERAEAAMIFKHKPPCNTQFVESFPFDTTTITTSGKNALMNVFLGRKMGTINKHER